MSGTTFVLPTDKGILDRSGLPRNAILIRCPPMQGALVCKKITSVVYVVDYVRVKTTVASLTILASVGHSHTHPNVLKSSIPLVVWSFAYPHLAIDFPFHCRDISNILIPSCTSACSSLLTDRSSWLLGRASESFILWSTLHRIVCICHRVPFI